MRSTTKFQPKSAKKNFTEYFLSFSILCFIRLNLLQAVEDLCMHKLSSRTYDRLKQECETHIHAVVKCLVEQVRKGSLTCYPLLMHFLCFQSFKTSDQYALLAAFDETWKNHIDQMGTIRNIFLYLDRQVFRFGFVTIKCEVLE